MFQDKLETELKGVQPIDDNEIEIIEASGYPRSDRSERIPGFINISNSCTSVDSPYSIKETETLTRRDLPSESAIEKSQNKPSANVHSVNSKFTESV